MQLTASFTRMRRTVTHSAGDGSPTLLQILVDHAGDRQGIIDAIQKAFHRTGEMRTRRAENTFWAVRDYGLLDKDTNQPTDLARGLLKLKARPNQLYDTFARHILLPLTTPFHCRRRVTLPRAEMKATLQRGIGSPNGCWSPRKAAFIARKGASVAGTVAFMMRACLAAAVWVQRRGATRPTRGVRRRRSRKSRSFPCGSCSCAGAWANPDSPAAPP